MSHMYDHMYGNAHFICLESDKVDNSHVIDCKNRRIEDSFNLKKSQNQECKIKESKSI